MNNTAKSMGEAANNASGSAQGGLNEVTKTIGDVREETIPSNRNQKDNDF